MNNQKEITPIEYAIGVLALGIRELGAEERLTKFITLFNLNVVKAPIIGIDNAIVEFKNSLLNADDNEPFDSFHFLLSRLMLECDTTVLMGDVNQLVAGIKKDLIFEGWMFEVTTPTDLLIFILRLYSYRIIELGKNQ